MTAGPISRVIRKNLADHAYEQLHSAIARGVLLPGQRFGDAAIAAQLNISRAPVREAIARLEGAGLVVGRPGRGWSVVEFSNKDVEEIYTLRASIEAFAAEQATLRITPEEFTHLEHLVMQPRSSLSIIDGAVPPIDMTFHEAVVRAAKHERVLAAWQKLLDQVTLVVSMSMRLLNDDLRDARRLHTPVLEAIRAGDSEGAAREARRHVLEVLELLMERRQDPPAEDL